MQFTPLKNEEQLTAICRAEGHQVIVKHNTSCSISIGVLHRLEKEKISQVAAIYLLDLLAHRDLSNRIAGLFGVPHQSPQLLLLKNGRCIYHEWGYDITAERLKAAIR